LRDRALWIPDQSSLFPSQVFSVGKSMPRDIAKELQDGVLEAAEVKPGMGIKAQINAACENLGYPRGHWRVRAAWYGGAGSWRGKAMFELLEKINCYRALKAQSAHQSGTQIKAGELAYVKHALTG
jgi:hypothetical protein